MNNEPIGTAPLFPPGMECCRSKHDASLGTGSFVNYGEVSLSLAERAVITLKLQPWSSKQ